MKVAIFGGGVAGLAAAAALRAHASECRVYERRSMEAADGHGFILSAQALADLTALGLSPEAAKAGVGIRQFRRYWPDGRLRHAQPMPTGWRAMRRADLVAALYAAVPDGTVFTGRALSQLTRDSGGAVTGAVLSTDQRTGAGGPGRQEVRADLYVAADGARSRARRALFPTWPQHPARVWEIVAMARHAGVSAWARDDFHKFGRPGLAAGLVPVGDESVVWFIQFDRARFAPPAAGVPIRALAERLVGDWAYPLPTLLRCSDFGQAHLWRPIDADLLPRFHSPNLALVGDAAHPLLPFTSQGVAAAIAGVRDLAATLERQPSLSAALEAYSVSCRARCAPYIVQGRELTRQFLQPDGGAEDILPMST